MTQYYSGKQYIGGQWLSGQGKPFISVNPADGSIIWQGNQATQSEVAAAVDAAKRALIPWSLQSFITRAECLRNFAKQIETHQQTLVELIAKESGKPRWEANSEVKAVIAKINLSIQAYHERNAEKRTSSNEATGFLRYKPHGVVAVLGPFNFPAHLSNGHIIPALLAGNTVVYKPSELTPAVAELILQCWHESGLPEGVINGIQGDASAAKHLMKQDIQGLYFTGSYKTGVSIHQFFSKRPDVIVALEMGGNNPLIIDNVENLSAAVYYTILSAFITAGQRCSCARRVMIPNNEKGDLFLAQLIDASKSIRVGDYTEEPEPFIGPVISYQHALSHLAKQEQLIAQGGKPLLTMNLLKNNTGLLSPGIVDMSDVSTPDDEEIFAPLVQVYRYREFEQALHLANQTHYGLAAGLLSDSYTRYQQFYNAIRAGIINWNRPTTGAASNLPFGGVGKSGNHRPSGYFAVDYCTYPIASQELEQLSMPESLLPGITP